jgi:hypothetical protein
MIANERQYEVSKRKLEELQQAHARAEADARPGVPVRARRAALSGIVLLMMIFDPS